MRKKSVIYLMKASRSRLLKDPIYKVGLSDNLPSRYADIASEWKRKRSTSVTLINSFPVKTSKKFMVESQIHRDYSRFRLPKSSLYDFFKNECSGDSEWFYLSSTDLKRLKQTMKKLSRKNRNSLFSRFCTFTFSELYILSISALISMILGFIGMDFVFNLIKGFIEQ